LYHRLVGSLKTSEQGDSVAGEGVKDPAADDRPVDTGAKIIIADAAVPTPRVVAPLPPRPNRPSQMPLPEPRSSLALVILLYVLSAGALAFAIYERFLA
jgi:hypothetical protein